jgi:hypothetical protein
MAICKAPRGVWYRKTKPRWPTGSRKALVLVDAIDENDRASIARFMPRRRRPEQ